ncbi:5-methyltetrahydropteroyltriglutamate--homocysteine S-methyltransferase [Bifidobacterium sp. SMB2]|uniref:5-methyltetrahydropteroyltriglutamate--homocysteine S-methyltransferase n=1 Tax=Bifidobacterium saimiriisciurei TaxID=2661627 RepID=A0ABX0CGW3_9BIFI|nr:MULTISPECIES: 5-methyltetrahydropteroyltriglutamate--homocysteine S-methyltransferase [Bifidobacterium]NEG96918.1 5-methyltetrahydropteroyltriglutamate--homocysteine S-methyltransferase [Bifidobacterium sp. SMB2]NEH11552.1 5-methyltetrahydropteroyltriglutamate--homocysteine S-methyltransferase [Bifidobacterium saimiriisciurei]
MAYASNAPFHADVVGSYLRPEALKQARADYEAGNIDAAALKAVEDKAIEELVARQKQAGLHVITDGEFRRRWWHFDFMWGFAGVEHKAAAHRVAFHDEVTPADTAAVTGRLDGHNHPFVEHFKFVKQFEDENTVARQTMPSPAQTLFVLTGNKAAYLYDEFYATDEELAADIVKAYRQTIADLYEAGCRNVQFDDCTWTRLCDPAVRERLGWSDEDAERLQRQNLDIINAVIEDQPADLAINTHVCRGNFHSTWLSSGGYAPVAANLFGKENVNAYYLEFDDDRSGDFAPLAELSENKKVVLGLITSKTPELEDPAAIKARIEEAAQYVPLERLCLSTQCGFASTEEGNKLTEEQQWAKIALVKSIADEVWGD